MVLKNGCTVNYNHHSLFCWWDQLCHRLWLVDWPCRTGRPQHITLQLPWTVHQRGFCRWITHAEAPGNFGNCVENSYYNPVVSMVKWWLLYITNNQQNQTEWNNQTQSNPSGFESAFVSFYSTPFSQGWEQRLQDFWKRATATYPGSTNTRNTKPRYSGRAKLRTTWAVLGCPWMSYKSQHLMQSGNRSANCDHDWQVLYLHRKNWFSRSNLWI